MSLEAGAEALAGRIPSLLPALRTEEGAKLSLVLPFLSDVLSYDWRDPALVEPEFRPLGSGAGARVDFALLPRIPYIAVECKAVGESISVPGAVGQLARYYREFGPVFGALTNGLVWRFFGSFGSPGEMDTEPFFEIDLEGLAESDFEGLRVVAYRGSGGVGPAVSWAARRWVELQSGAGGCGESRGVVERRALAVVREALRGAGCYGEVWQYAHRDDTNVFYGVGAGRLRLCRLEFRNGSCRVGLYGGRGNEDRTGEVGSVVELGANMGGLVGRVKEVACG